MRPLTEFCSRHLGAEGILFGNGQKAGAGLHGSFLSSCTITRYLFYAPLFAGDQGLSLLSGYDSAGGDSAFSLTEVRSRRYGADLLVSGCLEYR